MTIKINGTNTTAQPSITGTDTDTGLVYGTNEVSIVTGGAERVKIDTNGLKFNGDTAAANALDDYEEGTWTPVLGVSNGNSTHTQNYQIGYYVKVGSMVYIWCRVSLSALNSNGSGVCALLGLPFTVATTGLAQHRPLVTGYMNGFDNNFVPQSAFAQDNTTQARFYGFGDSDRERINSTLGVSRYTSSSDISLSGSYRIV